MYIYTCARNLHYGLELSVSAICKQNLLVICVYGGEIQNKNIICVIVLIDVMNWHMYVTSCCFQLVPGGDGPEIWRSSSSGQRSSSSCQRSSSSGPQVIIIFTYWASLSMLPLVQQSLLCDKYKIPNVLTASGNLICEICVSDSSPGLFMFSVYYFKITATTHEILDHYIGG